MRSHVKHAACWLLAAVSSLLLASRAGAQGVVMVACSGPGHCSYQRVYAVTLQGKDAVRLLAPSAVANAEAIRKTATVKLGSLHGLYREPSSGLLRVLDDGGTLGDVVLPSKLPQSAPTAAAAMAGATFECQAQAKGQGRTAVPMGQFVALIAGPPEAGVVEFIKREVMAGDPHPFRADLVAGALAFAKDSEDLRAWRGELRNTMQRSLAAFRGGGVDPSRLEAVLNGGLEAKRAYRAIAGDGQGEDALQKELDDEQRQFLERVTIARVFDNAGFHDAFLDEIDQIGLARWSRPELAAAVQDALQASVQSHAQAASDAMNARQYARAFDEASLASRRSPCDRKLANLYTNARVQFVNATAVQSVPDYQGRNRNELDQIVRALHNMLPDDLATPEGRADAKRRIRDGEEMDPHYLPLQLEKAQFLYNIKEFSAARDVVTDVERNVRLGRTDFDKWLNLDAAIDQGLSTLRDRNEKVASEQLAKGSFDAVLKIGTQSLVSDPGNPRLLYAAAVAAAVQRDVVSARQLAERYLRTPVIGCVDSPEAARNLLDLFNLPAPAGGPVADDGRTPNWMSGEPYRPGEVYYDPLSGSFQTHVELILLSDKTRNVSTDFVWDGVMVQRISSLETAGVGQPVRKQPRNSSITPVYDAKHVSMKEVGTDASTKTFPLTYLNSPDIDPVLAARLTGKATTRGWAGNPFFHPFVWEGVYLFDLEYDDLGRIRKATPVSDGVSRPSSPFVETLTFTWEGSTKRLKSITGAKYTRTMSYDSAGRLEKETIAYPQGKGWIEYHYEGPARQPSQAICEDDFYDKARRTVTLNAQQR